MQSCLLSCCICNTCYRKYGFSSLSRYSQEKKGSALDLYFLKSRDIYLSGVYERIPSCCLVIVENAKPSPKIHGYFLSSSNFLCYIGEYEIKNGFNYLGVAVMTTLRYHYSLKGNLCQQNRDVSGSKSQVFDQK